VGESSTEGFAELPHHAQPHTLKPVGTTVGQRGNERITPPTKLAEAAIPDNEK